ncbi:heavy-metal-associated domain-containing protein [Turneriella parva]|uniref:Heavy metal transport/detoxification protein n=1 Tax=Turneriella parva (strain ATCC BAA-1111 / DSM 21527 / NCTC 11395 / H) TaxID=869212 RepID=I4B1Y3_TURPD|nr:cation transporter [Turneriella parva]AFM11290.1 Heavy metal transport/detoxification protein [Turneriella parva DSM 21527]
MKEIELKIEGMTCGHCERTVEEVIRDAGATGKADRVAAVAHITYDESTDQLAKIREAIEENGYSVKN